MVDMKAKTRRRKWVWAVAGAGVLALVVTAALPFVFPSATVRTVIARTGLSGLPLTFGSAQLSPLGVLTLRDVVLADAGPAAGKPLVRADTVRVEFSWLGLAQSRLKAVRVDGAEVTLRPGEEEPVTLARVFDGEPEAPAATRPATTQPGGKEASPSAPLWIDLLSVGGVLKVEGIRGADPWLKGLQVPPGATLRLDGRMTMSGDRRAPARDFAVVLGEVDAQAALPGVVARGRVQGGVTAVLTLETLAVTNVSPAVGANLLADAPAWLRRGYRGRLNRVQVGGQITFGPETQVALLGEVHDLSVRAEDAAGQAPLSLDHLSVSTKVVGRWAGVKSMSRDLSFAPTHVSWEAAQVGGVRLARGLADLQSDGNEVVLTDLQTAVGDATASAMGAYDLRRDTLTRGRVWLNGVDVPKLVARLPAEWRRHLQGQLTGTLNGRLNVRELDGAHMVARVEVASRDGLELLAAGGEGAAPLSPEVKTRAVAKLSNVTVGAEVAWGFGADALPEVRGGRLTAAKLELVPPDGSEPLTAAQVVADFGMLRGVARLDDLYANFVDGARLGAEGAFDVRAQRLQGAKLSLENVEGELLSHWTGGSWGMKGTFDAQAQVSVAGPEAAGGEPVATVDGSVVLSPESSFYFGKMAAGVSGAMVTDWPTPMLSFRGSATFGGMGPGGVRAVTLETLSPRGFGTVRMDAASMGALREWLKATPGSAAEAVVSHVKGEWSAGFDDISVTGSVVFDDVPRAAGTVQVAGFSFNAPPLPGQTEGGFAAAGVNLHGTVAVPLEADWVAELRVIDATVGAQKLAAGEKTLTDLTAAVQVAQGKAAAKSVAFAVGEAGFTGMASMTLSPMPQVDGVRLNFRRLEQGIVTAALYPDQFTAQGPVSGELVLERPGGERGKLEGHVSFVTDGPGTVKLSRETVSQVFAGQARAAAQQAGSLIPENFEEILLGQFSNFPYLNGNVHMQDEPGGLVVRLRYKRKPLEPGDPGYAVPVTVAGQTVKANFEFDVPELSVTVNQSIAGLLGKALGFQKLVLEGPATRGAEGH
jgi:hypothetical protein